MHGVVVRVRAKPCQAEVRSSYAIKSQSGSVNAEYQIIGSSVNQGNIGDILVFSRDSNFLAISDAGPVLSTSADS